MTPGEPKTPGHGSDWSSASGVSKRGPITTPTRREVVSDLWHITLPLVGHSVGHVNVYVLMAPDGLILVDTGWGTRSCESILQEELRQMGVGLGDVIGVLLTHYHVDHCGLAGRLARDGGAWLGMHEKDASLLEDRYFRSGPYQEATLRWLQEAGLPSSMSEPALRQIDSGYKKVLPLTPDRLLSDGDVVQHGPWSLQVLHTPGHTPGHLCFYESRLQLLFTGDHLLRWMNTGATYRPQSRPTAMSDYLLSLRRLATLDVVEALPGHQDRISDFDGRVRRVDAYHKGRMAEAASAVGRGVDTVWGVASEMDRSRLWGELGDFAKLSACGETFAHLQRLEVEGIIASEGHDPIRWFPAS